MEEEDSRPFRLFSQPWRPMPEDNTENLDFVKSYQPQNNEVTHLRILLHGPVGAGRSSFINSVDSVLQGRVTGRALTDAPIGTVFTKKFKTYRITKDPEGVSSIIFNDIMGFEPSTNHGVLVEDVKLALKGHVKDGYQFKPDQQMTENDPYYEPSPTLTDRVHVLVSVLDAVYLSLMSDKIVKKMREVRLAASEMDIPQLVILTQIDKACPATQENIKNAYRSIYLKELVERCNYMLGVPVNCIFLMKNYETEITINDDISVLTLTALRQMIHFGEDYLNDQQTSAQLHVV